MPGPKDNITQEQEEILASYEELAALEAEFDEAETDIIRVQAKRFAPIFAKRDVFISKIANFWPQVIEQSPPELDQHIQPSDAEVLAESLINLNVDRFELDDPEGSPRSFSVTFTFADDNKYFTNKTLTKKFWSRRSNDDWVGLVSEPVSIDWKEGKDVTKGLNAAVIKLWQARAKAAKGHKDTELPEFKALVKKMEEVGSDAAESFFTFFSFVSQTRWISAEENKEATAKEAERREKIRKGEKIEEEDDEEEMRDADDLEQDILSEVFPEGEDLAIFIAEDLWLKATEYYTGLHAWDDEDISEMDEDEDDSEGEEVDIRALVGKGKKSSQSPPPGKKRKA